MSLRVGGGGGGRHPVVKILLYLLGKWKRSVGWRPTPTPSTTGPSWASTSRRCCSTSKLRPILTVRIVHNTYTFNPFLPITVEYLSYLYQKKNSQQNVLWIFHTFLLVVVVSTLFAIFRALDVSSSNILEHF